MTAIFFLAADLHAAAVDDGIGRVEQAVCALIGRGHAGDVVDPRVCQHVPLVDLGGVAHQTEHVVVLAGDQGHVQTLLLEFVNDLFQFVLGSAFFGGDDHSDNFLSFLHHDMRLAGAVGAQQLGQINAGVQVALRAFPPMKWP